MRLAFLLPIFCAIAAPAAAQNGNMVPSLTAPVTTPIDGWGVDRYYGAPPSLSRNMIKAQQLVAEGRFAEADPLLSKLIGRTNSRHLHFLKGVTALGLDEPATARRYFERALPSGRSGDPGAMSGLALAEVRLGNADAARHILRDLRYQQEKCRSDCDRALPLEQAVAVIERALT